MEHKLSCSRAAQCQELQTETPRRPQESTLPKAGKGLPRTEGAWENPGLRKGPGTGRKGWKA